MKDWKHFQSNQIGSGAKVPGFADKLKAELKRIQINCSVVVPFFCAQQSWIGGSILVLWAHFQKCGSPVQSMRVFESQKTQTHRIHCQFLRVPKLRKGEKNTRETRNRLNRPSAAEELFRKIEGSFFGSAQELSQWVTGTRDTCSRNHRSLNETQTLRRNSSPYTLFLVWYLSFILSLVIFLATSLVTMLDGKHIGR